MPYPTGAAPLTADMAFYLGKTTTGAIKCVFPIARMENDAPARTRADPAGPDRKGRMRRSAPKATVRGISGVRLPTPARLYKGGEPSLAHPGICIYLWKCIYVSIYVDI